MKVYSQQKIEEIKKLRLSGYSIKEIVDSLGIPKTSVWHHIKNLVISDPYKKILNSKRGGNRVRFNKRWDEAEKKAREILLGEKSKLAMAAAMLYWGEGGKKTCDIINTDPKLLQLYLKFLYEVIGISPDDIKFSMRIFTGMNPFECLDYWSANLKIDASKIILRYNDGGKSGKTKYGMCRITLKKGQDNLKLMHSLIRLSFSDLMGFEHPIAQWIDYRKLVDITNGQEIYSP